MSASPAARQAYSHAQAIPSRKVLLTDHSQMPDVYSSTPGGTLYSTTPGGNRSFVLRPSPFHSSSFASQFLSTRAQYLRLSHAIQLTESTKTATFSLPLAINSLFNRTSVLDVQNLARLCLMVMKFINN